MTDDLLILMAQRAEAIANSGDMQSLTLAPAEETVFPRIESTYS